MTFAPDRCYRPAEVWKAAHVPRSMVYDALAVGELRSVRRGRAYLIPGSAVISWLEGLAS